jgi:hypothetical protein
LFPALFVIDTTNDERGMSPLKPIADHHGPSPLPAIPFDPLCFDHRQSDRGKATGGTLKALLLISLGWLTLIGLTVYPEAQLIGIAACSVALMARRQRESECRVIQASLR